MLNDKNFILNSVLILSIVSLAIAYFIEHVLGHKPCNLCLIERIPYLSAVILIPLIFLINRFEKVIIGIVLSFFIFGALISLYHVGIEQGLLSESFVCDSGGLNDNLTKEDLLKRLQSKNVVSCKNVTFKLLGLSLATINTVISILLSGIIFKILMNYGQNK